MQAFSGTKVTKLFQHVYGADDDSDVVYGFRTIEYNPQTKLQLRAGFSQIGGSVVVFTITPVDLTHTQIEIIKTSHLLFWQWRGRSDEIRILQSLEQELIQSLP